jgi:outer membrane protein assembly factor BamB
MSRMQHDEEISMSGQRYSVTLAILLSAAAVLAAQSAQSPVGQSSTHNWPQWRGPAQTGVAPGDAPVRWSDTSGVAWKTTIPGRGFSSPVVWGDRVFITTAVPTGAASITAGNGFAGGGTGAGVEHRFEVLALDRETGQIAWQRTATVATPHEGYHREYGSFASNSPVTDGTHVWAWFGSRGIFCYDMDGTLVWQKDFGVQLEMHLQFGEGTAPALHGDRIFLAFDHNGDSFIVALDKRTGDEIWRTPREEISNWSMPLIVEHGGRLQVVVSAPTKTRAYDYDRGSLIWEAAGLGPNTIPAPVQLGDLVFAMSGFRSPKLIAMRLGGTGDLTDTDAVVWDTTRGTSYTPSPVLHDGMLYVLTDSGMLSNLDARTGTPHYQQVRLPKPYNFKASPVMAGDKLYLATEDEDVVVVRPGPKFDVIATNTLTDESFIATPAVAHGDLFLRSRTALYRINGS